LERTIVGIDVGTTKICTLIGEMDEQNELRVVGVGTVPSQGLRKGVIVNVAEASQAIATSVEKAERVSGYDIERAYLSLAGAHVSSVNSRGVVAIQHSERGVSQEDIDRALDGAHAIAIPHDREIVHLVPREYAVDGQEGIKDPRGMIGYRLEVEAHIVTGATSSIHNLIKCAEDAGVGVDELIIGPLASGEAVLSDHERELGVALADIGGGTTDIAIFIEGSVWHTTILAVGGNHLTNDIAVCLKMPMSAAEEAKINYGHACPELVNPNDMVTVQTFGAPDSEATARLSRVELAKVIEARMEEIFDLIVQEIKRSGYDGLLPAGLVLCGGTAELRGIRELGQRVLGLPVRVGRPHELHGLVDTLNSPAFATSVGLLQWDQHQFGSAPKKSRRLVPENGGAGLVGWLKNLLPDRA
jgi:cell division protein FtsA